MFLVVWHFFRSKLNSSRNRIAALAVQVKGLQDQLEYVSAREQAAMIEADQTGKAKNHLLSSLSHEIRTPMNGVLGMATLLKETELNNEQREYTDTIITSGNILVNKLNEILINDVISHSKMDALQGEPEQKNVDLKNCIEDVMDMFASKANHIELLYEIDPETPSHIMSDNKRLERVLINLIENAVTATRQGEVLVSVHSTKDEKSGKPMLEFVVADTGTGITKEVEPKLFTGILPENYSTKNNTGTKGFGLVICRKIVEQMGGQIRYSKADKGGATFRFTVPLNTPVQSLTNMGGYAMAGFEDKQVLIVNPHATTAAILKHQLEQWKLLPAVAASGVQALEILSQVSYSLVITCMDTPDMNGIELGQAIRNQYPQIPVLLLIPSGDDRYRPYKDYFGAVVNKPVRQHQLFDSVLSLLRNFDKDAGADNGAAKKLSENFSQRFPLRILVAEDNPVNQKWTLKILSKMGYRAVIAENGKMVLEIAGHEDFDLILMDVQMPEMDGLEATRMIRLCNDKQPVIIAMTANVMHGDRQACIQAGMDDYISKPVELSALVDMLEKWALVIRERA
jgi:CheY-like chemotaxis protein